MSYIFMKEPYGIVCEDNKLHIYNYAEQKIERTYMFEESLPDDFLQQIKLRQIVDMEKLLANSTDLEKGMIAKLIKQEFAVIEDKLSAYRMVDEQLFYEADRIGMNYANSNEQTVVYKVYKRLKGNAQNTHFVIVGSGQIAETIAARLAGYGCENISYADMDSIEAKSGLHIIYIHSSNSTENLFKFNELMIEKNLTWSLVAVTNENLIVGPTFFPGQTACLRCELEETFFENKYNVTEYEADILAGIFVSDIGKIIGDMPEGIVEDISITIGRMFILNRRTLNGESRDIGIKIDCPVCGKIK